MPIHRAAAQAPVEPSLMDEGTGAPGESLGERSWQRSHTLRECDGKPGDIHNPVEQLWSLGHIRQPVPALRSSFEPFAWQSLPELPRAPAQDASSRVELRSLVAKERLEREASELLLGSLELYGAAGVEEGAWREGLLGPVALRSGGGRYNAAFWLEPALAERALRRVFRRPVDVSLGPDRSEPVLLGALSALVVEVLRRAGTRVPLVVTRPDRAGSSGAPPTPQSQLTLPFVVSFESQRFRALLEASVRTEAASEGVHPAPLPALERMPLTMAVVVAASLVPRRALAELALGDAWMPSGGWLGEVQGRRRAVLAWPGTDWGVGVSIGSDGTLRVEQPKANLCQDSVRRGDLDSPAEENMSKSKPAQTITAATEEPAPKPLEGAAELLLEAPVSVRVEVGEVTLTGAQWCALMEGDVLVTAERLGAPAVLRVGGRAVAEGELVNVEGELGVKLVRFLSGERP